MTDGKVIEEPEAQGGDGICWKREGKRQTPGATGVHRSFDCFTPLDPNQHNTKYPLGTPDGATLQPGGLQAVNLLGAADSHLRIQFLPLNGCGEFPTILLTSGLLLSWTTQTSQASFLNKLTLTGRLVMTCPDHGHNTSPTIEMTCACCLYFFKAPEA